MGDWLDVLSVVNPIALVLNVEGRIFDSAVDAMASGVGEKCVQEAEAIVSPLDQRLVEIHSTWNPTGFYDPADVRQIVSAVTATAYEAIKQLGAAPLSTEDAESTIAQVRTGIQKRIDSAQVYLKTASEAQVSNIPVDAPGLKDWVLSTLRNARQGLLAAKYFSCSETWLERALRAVMVVLDAAWEFIKGVAGLVVALGEEVAKVPSFLASVITIAKYGALAYGAFWALRKYKERR